MFPCQDFKTELFHHNDQNRVPSFDTTMTTNSSTAGTMEQIVGGEKYRYHSGFGNEFSSEALAGALPIGRNTPRLVPFNMYTEQLSGTAFTAPRHTNKRTWLYRIQPSVATVSAVNCKEAASDSPTCPNVRLRRFFGGCNPSECEPVVDACRWHPMPSTDDFHSTVECGEPVAPDSDMADAGDEAKKSDQIDFVRALKLVCHAGDPALKNGLAIYQYSGISTSMNHTHLVNADGDFLIVPSNGTIQILTELGRLTLVPTEIAVIPRGIVFQVNVKNNDNDDINNTEMNSQGACGYVLEIYSAAGFQLPELGPIGSNGLANARDFFYPEAWCAAVKKEDYVNSHTILTKMHSELFARRLDHTPYNVVAWHGNYLPYKYDLTRFCAVNSVTYDHLDPSLYTVLTCPSTTPGTALADFVIFPPRALATDANTLRPPWFHRNTMSEYMGLIYGQYDAKKRPGFIPGGGSLHNCMTPHGPDSDSYYSAVADPCETLTVLAGGMAFMFETCLSMRVSPRALSDPQWRDMKYADCWQELSAFDFAGWDRIATVASDT